MDTAATSTTQDRLIDFTLYTQDDAPQASRALLVAAQQKFGFIPNVLRELAEAPTALSGVVQQLGLLEGSSLTAIEQRVVLLTVSFQNLASYCMAANSTMANMMGVPEEVIDAIRNGDPIEDARLQALRQFVTETVRERGVVSAPTKQGFLDAGFSKAQIFEVMLGVTLETMINYTEGVAGTLVDEQFKGYLWIRPDTAVAGTAS